jgi:hypothetical protein
MSYLPGASPVFPGLEISTRVACAAQISAGVNRIAARLRMVI